MRLLRLVGNHLRQAGERLLHASHLTGDVHVPHLIAVARLGAALSLCAVGLHVGAVMQSVPHPEAHVLGNDERLGGELLVVHEVGDVDKSGQLLMHGVVRGPHALFVVVGRIALNEGAVLGGNGVDVSVAVVGAVGLVTIEILPCAAQLSELALGRQVAGLTVTAQLLVVNKRHLLALAHLVDHILYVLLELLTLCLVRATGVGHGHGRKVMARSVALELRGGRVPSVAHGIAVGGQSVGVAVVVNLLARVEREQVVDVEVAVVRQAVFSNELHAPQGQRLSHGLGLRNRSLGGHHAHMGRDGESGGRLVVANDVTLHIIG